MISQKNNYLKLHLEIAKSIKKTLVMMTAKSKIMMNKIKIRKLMMKYTIMMNPRTPSF